RFIELFCRKLKTFAPRNISKSIYIIISTDIFFNIIPSNIYSIYNLLYPLFRDTLKGIDYIIILINKDGMRFDLKDFHLLMNEPYSY
ncbi:MAG: hypothetical protein RBR68_16120, partial [Tenuifilaceae bacterium]|nr:hypothetical protein [Tenuifilaceae bacterium]